MSQRLHKVLSAAGIASRRGAEELIARGAVTVNGGVASLGQRVDPAADVIAVRGRVVSSEERPRMYIALHKPRGYVTSLRSTHGERTVADLVHGGRRLFPVGRLDKDTSGLLLLTDDGDWANFVTHPRFGVEKEYIAVVRGRPGRSALEKMRLGIMLPDGSATSPARVTGIGQDRGNARLRVVVTEGKKRQIRLMMESVGYPVMDLCRVRIGPIRLGALAQGRWRQLEIAEVEAVHAHGDRGAGAGSAEATPARCD